MDLDSLDSNQVESAQTVTVFIGNPTRTLVVCSGIAIPNWDSQGNLDYQTVRINLNVQATALLASTAVVGLASIVNGTSGGSEFTFATDSAFAEMVDGVIYLVVSIGVQGSPSTLSRFSYQVHLLISKDQAMISGTIEWSDSDVTLTSVPPYLFTIAASILIPPSGGSFGGPVVQVTVHEDPGIGVLKFGGVKAAGRAGTGVHQYTYSMPIPPTLLNTPLLLSCEPYPGAFVPTGGNRFVSAQQISGPSPVILTSTHLVENDVDFQVVTGLAPK
ncbi:MAG: hypothetical protein WBS19_09605 [Candidatus Korobacteraceae bacterium]